jgi:Ca-activated chloride channel family protein
MQMRIGDRTIRSVVREKREAHRTYEHAKSTGRKAALLDRHRPNLFTTSAANINPGETVAIVLEYLDEVDFEDGAFGLSFPLAYLPRYAPQGYLDPVDSVERAALLGCSDTGDATVPAVSLEVRLRPGIPLEWIDSDSHTVRGVDEGGLLVVRPEEDRIPAERDFHLRWKPRLEGHPQPALYVEERPDGRYAMLMLFPPVAGSEAGLGLPTETLFIVDVSGSMGGPSIEQARLALLAALDRLRPDDRFNILRFNDGNEAFRAGFENAAGVVLDDARAWVRDLRAGGGTEIHGALARGLEMMGASTSSHAQRILFLTDGAIANEDRVYATIASELGQVRLHTIGIGPAPNGYLMRKMARFGRGLCRFVSAEAQARNQVAAFFEQVDRPVMTDLALEWDALEPGALGPPSLPDLHAGRPFVLFGRLDDGESRGAIRLTGHTRTGWVESVVEPTTISREATGIATRWAGGRVEALIDSLHEGADPDGVRADVVDLALAFDLVTKYTSLVAVDDTPTALGPSRSTRMASALPQGGTGGPLRLLVGFLLAGVGTAIYFLLRR